MPTTFTWHYINIGVGINIHLVIFGRIANSTYRIDILIDSSYLQLNDLTYHLIFPMLAGEPPPAKGPPDCHPP